MCNSGQCPWELVDPREPDTLCTLPRGEQCFMEPEEEDEIEKESNYDTE